MELSDFLRMTTEVLERLSIPYLVTGSIATIAYGEPRLTNDIDIVAAMRIEQIDDFCAAFPHPDFYCSQAAVRDAVVRKFQFNILHPATGLKVDVMIPEDSEFNRSRLSRGLRLPAAANLIVRFASPEDAILKKLEYYREGGSEKHLRDIASVIKIRGDQLDLAYLELWASRLGVAELWQEVREQATSRG